MDLNCLERNNRISTTGGTRLNYPRRRSKAKSCCIRMQILFSYILMFLSSSTICYGTICFYQSTNHSWLVLPGIGIIFILAGSLIYRNGVLKLSLDDNLLSTKAKSKRSRRYTYNNKRSARESHIFESHLSINMLPQCFNSLDITPRNRNTTNQRYFMLPVGENNRQAESPRSPATITGNTTQIDHVPCQLDTASMMLNTNHNPINNDHAQTADSIQSTTRIRSERDNPSVVREVNPSDPVVSNFTTATIENNHASQTSSSSLLRLQEDSDSNLNSIIADEAPPSYEEVIDDDNVLSSGTEQPTISSLSPPPIELYRTL